MKNLYDPYGKMQNPPGFEYFGRIVHAYNHSNHLLKEWFLMCSWEQCGYYIYREVQFRNYERNNQKKEAKLILLEDMEMIGFGPDDYSSREIYANEAAKNEAAKMAYGTQNKKKSEELRPNFVATNQDMAVEDAWLRVGSSRWQIGDRSSLFKTRSVPGTQTRLLYTHESPRPGLGKIQHLTAGRGGEPSYDPGDFVPSVKIGVIEKGAGSSSKLYLEPEHRTFGYHGPEIGGYGTWTPEIARNFVTKNAEVVRKPISPLNPTHQREGPWFCYKTLYE